MPQTYTNIKSKLKQIAATEILYVKTGQYNIDAFRVTKLNLNQEQATKDQTGSKCTAIHSLQ